MMQPRVDSAVIMTGLRQSSNPHGSRESIMLWCIPHSLFPRNKRQTSAIKEKLDAMDAYQGEGASSELIIPLLSLQPHGVSMTTPCLCIIIFRFGGVIPCCQQERKGETATAPSRIYILATRRQL